MPDAPDDFALARSTSFLLNRAYQVAADRFSAAAGVGQLSLRQFAVLAAIADKPGASQNDLVRAVSVDRSTLADMLKRLAAQGLVAKAASTKDARANEVALTAAGQRMLDAAFDHARKADQAVLGVLPKSKRKTFQETLQRLARALDEAAEKAERDERKRRKRDAKRAQKDTKKANKKAALKAARELAG